MKVHNSPGSYGLFAGLLVLLLGVIVNSMACCYAASAKHATVMQEYEASVEITATCIKPDMSMVIWYGTGVAIDSDHVITAGHVANDLGMMCSFQVETWRGETRFMFVKHLDTANDLALLELSLGEKPLVDEHVRFGVKPRIGDIVCAATSHPMHMRKCGEVQPYSDTPGDIHFGVVVEPGNSGSGLYNEDGELVGIVVMLRSGTNGQWISGLATSLESHLKDLLQ